MDVHRICHVAQKFCIHKPDFLFPCLLLRWGCAFGRWMCGLRRVKSGPRGHRAPPCAYPTYWPVARAQPAHGTGRRHATGSTSSETRRRGATHKGGMPLNGAGHTAPKRAEWTWVVMDLIMPRCHCYAQGAGSEIHGHCIQGTTFTTRELCVTIMQQ